MVVVVWCQFTEISVVAGVELDEFLSRHTGLVSAHEVVVLVLVVVTAKTENLVSVFVDLELDVHDSVVRDDDSDASAVDVDDVEFV